MTLPPDPYKWRQLAGSGGYATYEPAQGGHLIVVSQPGLIQAQCTCGWQGPDRTADPHSAGLVMDDTAQHSHDIGGICPDRCMTCTPEDYQ